MWPLSISYPCLVLILLVKYTVKWKMIALFIIKIKLYRPLKNNLDNFNFWYMFSFWLHIFFLLHLNYCTFPLHMNLLGFLNLVLILRFLFFYDLLSHYFDWFLSTLKNHNIQKPRPPKNFLPKYTTSITWTCNGKFTFWIFKRTWPNFCKVMIKRLCKKFIYLTYWHRYNGNVRCQ